MAKKSKNTSPKDDGTNKKKLVSKPLAKNKPIEKKTSKKGKATSSPSSKKTKKTTEKNQKVGGFSRNNFNYIRSLIWKHHRNDFPSYFDPSFIRVVREIFNDCKAAGVSCTEEIILEKYQQFKSDDKRPKPYVLPYFQQPRVYYEIKDVPFPTFSPYLYIVSPMIIPYPHEFRVTEYYRKRVDSSGREELDIKGYDKFFAKWVNWCNSSMRMEHGSDYSSEELEICFKMSDAIYNPDKKRWESFIYTCTPMGRVFNFGYKPEGELEKDEEPEYKIPTSQQLSEKPITKKEQEKIKRIVSKQKKIDATISWNNFFSSVKKSKEKADTEQYAKELSELGQMRKELEKLIRKYKREKNTKKLKEVNKKYDALTDRYMNLINKRFK